MIQANNLTSNIRQAIDIDSYSGKTKHVASDKISFDNLPWGGRGGVKAWRCVNVIGVPLSRKNKKVLFTVTFGDSHLMVKPDVF